MNWIESLYQTYESCASSVGSENDAVPLAPIAHTIQQTHIEITLNHEGVIQGAVVSPAIVVIPCSEASAGRTNSPEAHPLSDKLKYIAADFYDRTGETPTKQKEGETKKTHHRDYVSLVSAWAGSRHSDPKLKAVSRYLESNGGKVMADLCKLGVYPSDASGLIPKKWGGDKSAVPKIYETTKNYPAPWDVFVRWRVTIPGVPEDRTYLDKELWAKWTSYYLDSATENSLCYVLGETLRPALQHPKRIRSIADGAKLISSNDSSGFTFRGRFTDPDGSQACGVSFEVTQKAHNALRWLIARQGRRDGDQAIVAWAVSGKEVPPLIASTKQLLIGDAEEDDEDYLNDEADEAPALVHAAVAQEFALALKHKIGGYRRELGDASKIVVLALDSATPGRMAITYYRELSSSEFLKRIERWHEECAWMQYFGRKNRFVGAPAPRDVAQCAYGSRLDDKLLAATQRRLLPCIVDSAPLPADLVSGCVRRACARQSMEPWEWEKALGIACGLYRKQQAELQNHHSMSLERTRKNRDYLYGRLLAVADHLEGSALRSAGEKRDTNASRLMQSFADRPYSTWRTIELSLDPYRRRLLANSPALLSLFNKELEEIMDLFSAEDFIRNEKLSGEFLLAFHTQRTALWEKKSKEEEPAASTSGQTDQVTL